MNRLYFLSALVLSVASWMLFKFFYPNPNINFDGYYYIYAALIHADVSVWPIGYSKFLEFIGLFSHSAPLLVAIQYFFLQACIFFFFVTIRYYFRLGKWAGFALFVLLFLNPIYIYSCNLVLSDTLFLGVSLLWLVNLVWIVNRPAPWMIITQAVLLLLSFTIRPSALYYPLIAAIAFLLSRQRVGLKIAGITLPCILAGAFMLYSSHVYQSLYGVKQSAAFQGWKLASNALYSYEHIPPDKLEPVPVRFRSVDSVVNRYFHSRHDPVSILNPDPSWGTYYVFMYPSPLLVYKDMQYGHDRHFLINVATFSKLSPLYDSYGAWLIKKYPQAYVHYFVLPNMWLYMMPFTEVYTDWQPFRLQRDTMGYMAKKWFPKVSLAAPIKAINARTALFEKFPFLNLCTHAIFLVSLLGFVSAKGWQKVSQPLSRTIVLLFALWAINFLFWVSTSASLLRYQLFIIVVESAMAVYFIQLMMEEDKGTPSVARAMRSKDASGPVK